MLALAVPVALGLAGCTADDEATGMTYEDYCEQWLATPPEAVATRVGADAVEVTWPVAAAWSDPRTFVVHRRTVGSTGWTRVAEVALAAGDAATFTDVDPALVGVDVEYWTTEVGACGETPPCEDDGWCTPAVATPAPPGWTSPARSVAEHCAQAPPLEATLTAVDGTARLEWRDPAVLETALDPEDVVPLAWSDDARPATHGFLSYRVLRRPAGASEWTRLDVVTQPASPTGGYTHDGEDDPRGYEYAVARVGVWCDEVPAVAVVVP